MNTGTAAERYVTEDIVINKEDGIESQEMIKDTTKSNPKILDIGCGEDIL